jgi:hypothetical protein
MEREDRNARSYCRERRLPAPPSISSASSTMELATCADTVTVKSVLPPNVN